MIIEDNIITFEEKDWQNGIAKRVVEILKSNKSRYNPTAKKWTASEQAMEIINSRNTLLEAQGGENNMQTMFGMDKDGNATADGLLGLYKHIKDIKSLLQEFERRNASDEIINKYSIMCNELEQHFDAIINNKEKEILI